MPIDPVKIPQNVYVEDRIIGPITLKQIMIVMGGVGVSYAIWATMKSAGPVTSVQTVFAWIPAVLAALFAFVKINGISLFNIVLLTLEKAKKPARRVWIPRQGIYVNIVTKTPTKKKKNDDVLKKEAQRKGTPIEELSKLLDKGPPEPTLDPNAEDEQVPAEIAEIDTEKTKPKPVNPNRIKADSSDSPLDDITVKRDEPSSENGPLLRDIIPPTSHA